jgi:hypothetical protein
LSKDFNFSAKLGVAKVFFKPWAELFERGNIIDQKDFSQELWWGSIEN